MLRWASVSDCDCYAAIDDAKCVSLSLSGGRMDPAPSTWAPPGQRSHSSSFVQLAVRKFELFLFGWF